MLSQPPYQFTTRNLRRRDTQNKLLLLIHASLNFKAVEEKRHFHCGVTDAFVTVHERVILNEQESESRCFFREARVKFGIAEGHGGLNNCRFQSA